jgi:hypothetical protein
MRFDGDQDMTLTIIIRRNWKKKEKRIEMDESDGRACISVVASRSIPIWPSAGCRTGGIT